MGSLKPQELHEFYYGLGRFISQFAEVETLLVVCTQAIADIPMLKLLAIGQNFRVDASIQVIRRLSEISADSAETKAELLETLTQIAHINEIRNNLLHHQTLHEDGEQFNVTNQLLARNKSLVKSYPISAKILGQMTDDMEKAWAHLWCYYDKSMQAKGYSAPDSFTQRLESLRLEAWQYKPAQPTSKKGKTRSTTPKRPRQRKASAESA